jgi:hypothetical protein
MANPTRSSGTRQPSRAELSYQTWRKKVANRKYCFHANRPCGSHLRRDVFPKLTSPRISVPRRATACHGVPKVPPKNRQKTVERRVSIPSSRVRCHAQQPPATNGLTPAYAPARRRVIVVPNPKTPTSKPQKRSGTPVARACHQHQMTTSFIPSIWCPAFHLPSVRNQPAPWHARATSPCRTDNPVRPEERGADDARATILSGPAVAHPKDCLHPHEKVA